MQKSLHDIAEALETTSRFLDSVRERSKHLIDAEIIDKAASQLGRCIERFNQFLDRLAEEMDWTPTHAAMTTKTLPESAQHLRNIDNRLFDRQINIPVDLFDRQINIPVDIAKPQQALPCTIDHVQRLMMTGMLTGAIAHEIRQPLFAIAVNAKVIQRQLNSPKPPLDEARRALSDICLSNLRANQLVDRVLGFMRNEHAPRRPVDLNDVVSAALGFVACYANQQRVRVATRLAEGLPFVIGDHIQLQQVVTNLVVNGIQSMATASPSKRLLTVCTTPSRTACAEVAVTDTGTGIHRDALPHLFKTFHTTRAEGTGLGLSVARLIVASHGGEIRAENNAGGRGATFRFTVPLASRCGPNAGARRDRQRRAA